MNRRKWEKVELQYLRKREEWLKLNHSELSDIKSIARRTYGMSYPEIDRMIRREGYFPFDSLRSRASFDPETNIYHENSFTPNELTTILFNMGMVTSFVRSKSVFDFKKRSIISWFFTKFPHLSLNISPAYEILAVKR